MFDMTAIGTYSDKLPCGGTLKVSRNDWKIEYYFSGPDLRYNGTFVRIPSGRIDSYIDAFQKNWEEYEKLKIAIPSGGDFSKVGANGMTIRIGNFASGVCLQSYHMPLKTREAIDRVVSSYRHAKERAKTIQPLLQSL